MISDYAPALTASLGMVEVQKALESIRTARALFERLARPPVSSESGEFEAASAATARDLAESERRLEELRRDALTEFLRICNGRPALTVIEGGAQS